MTIQVKHSKVSTIPDTDDTSLVRPSDWNADHTLVGVGTMAEQNSNNVNITGGSITGVSGLGDVTGPASATDNAIARFDSTTGKLVQNSVVTVSDTGGIAGATTITDINYVDFNTAYATTLTTGQLGWNGNNTLGLGMSGGNIVQEIGLQTFIYGKASSAITKGQLIKKTGANGSSGVITFAPTTANMTNSTDIIGIAAEDIALNGFGYIMSTGNLRGFNTTGASSGETWADGDTLYYNPAGNGLMTKTKPSAPNSKTEVAVVTNAGSGGSGSVVVEIIHGSQLGGTDSNVQLTSPTTGQTLVYNQPTGIWNNSNAPTIIGGSINNTPIGATTPSTGVFSDLTDSSLTSGRVTYAGTGGNLRDASNFTYDGTNLVAGAIQNTPIGATTSATGKFTTLESTGTGSFGTTSAQYIQAVGNATEPQILAAGSGTNIPLVLQPKGTGAIQAQATTSTTAGGNARGSYAVDWQTARFSATHVASGNQSVISGGTSNLASGASCVSVGGYNNRATGTLSFVGAGTVNTSSGVNSSVTGGNTNTASGYYGFVGNGFTNSTTSNSAVTTQSGTMNGTSAVTLSGSNANIRVGQYITGTSIDGDTYVAAISGTSLTLSKNASGSSTSTLSFFTPHGVVVGGGNNQATGSYSFIGGGGDAGTAANRNVASGDWSVVGGGLANQATGIGAFIGGGGTTTGAASGNVASGTTSTICGGANNTASGAQSFVGGGLTNIASAAYSSVLGGRNGTVRAIQGNMTFPACTAPIANTSGVTQSSLLLLGRETTDATPTVLASNSAAAGTTNQVILPNNSAYYFTGEIVSGVTGGGNSKGWEISGLIKRGANAAATTLVGSTVTSLYADAGAATWTIALAADTTNGGLRVTFTGQAGTTIRTVCQIRTTEMTF